jgi:molybdenum cofactor synthesis domain-containing protein
MRPFKSLITLEQALEIIEPHVSVSNETESIPIRSATDRILAEDIVAKIDVPPFSRSAMDGYAVIAEDTFGAGQFKPKVLKCIDTVYAGEVSSTSVNKGECIKIATGAMLPEGADAVVMIEDTSTNESESDMVNIFKPVYPDANVSKQGEDIHLSDTILKAGEVLNPSRIGAVAAIGIGEVKVYKKPKVAVVPTGNEVCPVGKELSPGQVYDINSYTLSTIVNKNGAESDVAALTPDTFDAIKTAVYDALDNDIVVLSGGSSVGEKDIIVDVIQAEGEILFHGVQIKPGKPVLCGRIKGKVVLGLPGYPTACMTSAYMFLAPVIRKLAHLPPQKKQTTIATISRRVVSTLGRLQILTVRLEDGKAIPVFKESGAITSMANADGYIEIPINVDLIEEGEEVEVTLL